jgi:hypothetical protein
MALLRPRRLLALAALVGALLALRVILWRPFEVAGETPRDGYARVAGVVHVHTSLSDGGGTPEEVIRAARATGLGFVAITDHNNLDAKPFEGYRDGVLVLVGSELSTNAGHILGLGIPDPVFRFSGDPKDGLEDVRYLGGFSFAAHPLNPREDLRFTGWDLPGPWGLELLNGDSEWRRAGARNVLTALLYGLNRRYALLGSLGPPDDVLARWDGLLALRDVPGIAGADAHSRLPLTRSRSVRFPSYEALFALARNYALLDAPLTGEAARDTPAVLDALRRGRSYVGLDALAPAGGFSFTVEGPDRRGTMGESVLLAPGLVLRAGGQVPRGARLLLLRDGRPLREALERIEEPVPGPGVYRVEARVPGWHVPWILTNPIAVFDQAPLRARAAAASWPAPADPPAAAVVLDSFDGRTVFQAGHDPASTLDENILDPKGGVGGSGAARLAFRLGVPTAANPNVFCAIVNRDSRDLSGRQGLVFSIRGDGTYRIWVQVRDENPASTDEGTEWWFASVRTAPEWRRVALPFARFRSINPKTDGRLDLDKVRALVFVLDRGADKPGTEGTIWIDELGAY